MMNTKTMAAPSRDMGDGSRAAHRHKTFQPTMMTTPAGSFRVHLINVSSTGALVHLNEPPLRGTHVAIDVGTRSANARVVWTHGARFGLAFECALEDKVIECLLIG